MSNEFLAVLQVAGQTIIKIVPITIALGIVFALLTHWSACNPGQPWWRKREIVTDVCYWFLIPLGARFVRIGLMVMGAAYIYNIHGADALIKFYDNGFGPLADYAAMGAGDHLPGRVGLPAVLVPPRSIMARSLWKYHAVHHSSEEVDWISAARFHPVNILFGTVLVDVGAAARRHLAECDAVGRPVHHASSAFVHANLNWTLGPFKYVIAGPVFHRWHHTAAGPRRQHEFRRHASRSGTCCSAPSTCRRTSCRTPMASTTSSFPESFGAPDALPVPPVGVAGDCVPRSLHFVHQFAVNSRVSRPRRRRGRVRDVSVMRVGDFDVGPCSRVAGDFPRLGLDDPLRGHPRRRTGASRHRHRLASTKRRCMKLPTRVATIVIGNPLIADAALQAGGILVITGKGYG